MSTKKKAAKKKAGRKAVQIVSLNDQNNRLVEVRVMFNYKLAVGLEKEELYTLANRIRQESNGAVISHLGDANDGIIRLVYNRAMPNAYNVHVGATQFKELISSKMT